MKLPWMDAEAHRLAFLRAVDRGETPDAATLQGLAEALRAMSFRKRPAHRQRSVRKSLRDFDIALAYLLIPGKKEAVKLALAKRYGISEKSIEAALAAHGAEARAVVAQYEADRAALAAES